MNDYDEVPKRMKGRVDKKWRSSHLETTAFIIVQSLGLPSPQLRVQVFLLLPLHC